MSGTRSEHLTSMETHWPLNNSVSSASCCGRRTYEDINSLSLVFFCLIGKIEQFNTQKCKLVAVCTADFNVQTVARRQNQLSKEVLPVSTAIWEI